MKDTLPHSHPIRVKFEFTEAQVLAFGPAGPEILPPVPGYYYRVVHQTFVKRAGPAFTVPAFGAFVQIQYMNAQHTPASNNQAQGVLDQTDEASGTGNPASIGQFTSGTGTVFNGVADIGGVGLRMGVNGGYSYGGVGAPCILDLQYYLQPASSEALDQIETTPLP